jgi:hypothetical protein
MQTDRPRSVVLRALLTVHVVLVVLLFAPGCHSSGDPQAGLKATHADPETARFSYWANQPGVASVEADDFDRLWRACRRVTSGANYTIDRVDFRTGRLTTLPLVSKQAFEFWRNDLASAADVSESTLSTVRRTVQWDVAKQDDGTFRATPKVVVERYVMEERRLTSAMQYQEVFSDEHRVEGSELRDEGILGPEVYWYATGRDHNMEQRLAGTVERLLRG